MIVKQGLFASAVVALTMAAGTGAAFADKVTWRLHTQVVPPHPYNDAADYIARSVSEQTGGEFTIKLFHSATLGQDAAVLDEIRLGTVDMIISSCNNAAKHVPEYQVFSLAYLWPSYDVFTKATKVGGPIFNRFQALYDEKKLGMKLLGLGSAGTRNLSNAKKPVNTVADVAGFKMRVPPSPVMAQVWQAVGTLPVSVAWPELYAGIQTGLAEALEASISGYYGSKLYEVTPYLALTKHEVLAGHITASKRSYDKLSAKQQAILDKASVEAALLMTKSGIAADEELLKTLQDKHGVKVTRPELGGFIKAVSPLQDKLAKDMKAEDLLTMVRKASM